MALVKSPVSAQQQDGQVWLQVSTNVPLSDDLRPTLEQIARVSDRQDGLYQTEFGGLLSYRVIKGFELGFGYREVVPIRATREATKTGCGNRAWEHRAG